MIFIFIIFYVIIKQKKLKNIIVKYIKQITYCSTFITLEKGTFKKFNNKHTHRSNDLDAIRKKSRKKLTNTILFDEDPFTINVQKIYKNYSLDKGTRASSFYSIKTSLYNEVNKNLPKDILLLRNALSLSIYYNTFQIIIIILYYIEIMQ